MIIIFHWNIVFSPIYNTYKTNIAAHLIDWQSNLRWCLTFLFLNVRKLLNNHIFYSLSLSPSLSFDHISSLFPWLLRRCNQCLRLHDFGNHWYWAHHQCTIARNADDHIRQNIRCADTSGWSAAYRLSINAEYVIIVPNTSTASNNISKVSTRKRINFHWKLKFNLTNDPHFIYQITWSNQLIKLNDSFNSISSKRQQEI